jgi:V/A-type H+-transporting ATPase subunit I
MGTVPGYRELDISMWFLAFFSVFFAMLIGDAGYGAVLLILTIAGMQFLKKLPPEPFVLMYVLSVCTVIWGTLSGNWFGCEAIARLPVLSALVVPALNTFSDGSSYYVQYICFVLGAVHLSLAHLVAGLKVLNSLKAIAQLGWILVVWAMFLVIRTIMLEAPLNAALAGILGGAGLAMVVFFSWPSKSILWTILYGIAEVPMNLVDVFKDSLSYIRLFAVGLATFYVAQSFNSLAATVGFSSVLSAPVAILIILIGHGMNIVLALMSVAVHGFRLNMLEFSGHIGMAWAGKEYRPFRRKSLTEKGVA